MTRQPIFSEAERDATAYFFLRLKNIYGGKYLAAYPDEESVRLAKREWAKQIGQYSREDIDRMFDMVKQQQAKGDEEYQWPNIGLILGAASVGWEHKRLEAAEKEWQQTRKDLYALEDQVRKERIKKAADVHLAKMKGLFGWGEE